MKRRKIKRYGWVPDLGDFRDHPFEPPKLLHLPDDVDLRPKMPPVYEQKDLGSCTANAIAAILDFERMRQGETAMTPSRLFIYYNERDMEGTVDYDAGAMIRDGIKSVVELGVCPESNWPYEIGSFTIKPPPGCYRDALDFQALRYRRINSSVFAMKACLAQGFPFVCGFTVFESFESDVVTKTGMVPMPKPNEAILGGHAVVVVGHSASRAQFLVRNSWGDLWALAGYFWMPMDYLANPDLADDRWQISKVE